MSAAAAPGTAPQRHSRSSHAPSSSSSGAKPQVRASSSAIIPETTGFQGTYPVAIGAGTVLHPRAKIYSYDGPVIIGDGCIVGEKTTVGISSAAAGSAGNAHDSSLQPPSTETSGSTEMTARHTIVENFVNLGPLSTVCAGSHIRYCTTIEASAYLSNNVRVGKHSKVCPNCRVPENGQVGDWSVAWGGPTRLHRRVRANGEGQRDETGKASGLGGRAVEEGRLIVLNKEREIVRKLMAASLSARKR